MVSTEKAEFNQVCSLKERLNTPSFLKLLFVHIRVIRKSLKISSRVLETLLPLKFLPFKYHN